MVISSQHRACAEHLQTVTAATWLLASHVSSERSSSGSCAKMCEDSGHTQRQEPQVGLPVDVQGVLVGSHFLSVS